MSERHQLTRQRECYQANVNTHEMPLDANACVADPPAIADTPTHTRPLKVYQRFAVAWPETFTNR